jgi:hypothetical protein
MGAAGGSCPGTRSAPLSSRRAHLGGSGAFVHRGCSFFRARLVWRRPSTSLPRCNVAPAPPRWALLCRAVPPYLLVTAAVWRRRC